MNQIIERLFKREVEEAEIIASHTPIVETYIQIEKSKRSMGTVPKNDLYFLGIADFQGKKLKVRPMDGQNTQGSIVWSFEPVGFLQMSFLDRGEFDKDHYKIIPAGRTFLGDVRCYLSDVARAKHQRPKIQGSNLRRRPGVVRRPWSC
jgi:hypothetical protein